MDCLSDEKMVNFITVITEELRELMSKKEIVAIKAHLAVCSKCRENKEKYEHLIKRVEIVGKEKKKQAPLIRGSNGDDLILASKEEKIALLKSILGKRKGRKKD